MSVTQPIYLPRGWYTCITLAFLKLIAKACSLKCKLTAILPAVEVKVQSCSIKRVIITLFRIFPWYRLAKLRAKPQSLRHSSASCKIRNTPTHGLYAICLRKACTLNNSQNLSMCNNRNEAHRCPVLMLTPLDNLRCSLTWKHPLHQ